jgi:hypothetical protein
MSSIESISSAIEKLLEAAKDVPSDKIAMVGLIILGSAAIVKDLAKGSVSNVIGNESIIDIDID